jgi:putative SOS response-associated peptidase YedK
MCGRYVSPDDAAIEREFNLVRAEWKFPASYNVAPTDDVAVVRLNKEGERTGSLMHWGLIPYWVSRSTHFDLHNIFKAIVGFTASASTYVDMPN